MNKLHEFINSCGFVDLSCIVAVANKTTSKGHHYIEIMLSSGQTFVPEYHEDPDDANDEYDDLLECIDKFIKETQNEKMTVMATKVVEVEPEPITLSAKQIKRRKKTL